MPDPKVMTPRANGSADFNLDDAFIKKPKVVVAPSDTPSRGSNPDDHKRSTQDIKQQLREKGIYVDPDDQAPKNT
ncbi:hypothetical protein TWF718_000146 [Orbilia javanica]|uniref:Uncharacterized protein n=1 Tax=Orbilia javanica TaxID=47235 RepID=A0AAN8NAE5_9PEZI